MKYIDHMKVLTHHFIKNMEIETSIACLSQHLNCSERHVKTVVNYLNQHGLIRWDVQRGRGKKPKITVLYSTEEIQMIEAKLLVEYEQYKDAFQIVQQLNSHSAG